MKKQELGMIWNDQKDINLHMYCRDKAVPLRFRLVSLSIA